MDFPVSAATGTVHSLGLSFPRYDPWDQIESAAQMPDFVAIGMQFCSTSCLVVAPEGRIINVQVNLVNQMKRMAPRMGENFPKIEYPFVENGSAPT